jgi:hypothetical protein
MYARNGGWESQKKVIREPKPFASRDWDTAS